MSNEHGYCEGDTCGRNGCNGKIEIAAVRNCSCHLSAPCHGCVSPRAFCNECDWRESDDYEEFLLNNYKVTSNKETGSFKAWTPRPLDNTKIDWYSKSHSSCSMQKIGVYPPGTTQDEVREAVAGTFGGRFESFGDGKFSYIAYTD